METINYKGRGVRGKKALSLIITIFCLMTGTAWAAGEQIADYTAQPPFLPDVVPPNILFVLDMSRNMFTAAYGTYPISPWTKSGSTTTWSVSSNTTGAGLNNTTTETFSRSTTYSGIFNSMKCYAYGSNGFEDSTATAKALITSSCPAGNPWDGNFLNWVTMRKMDVAKKVLVGGKPTSASGSNVIKLGVETPSSASDGCDMSGNYGECWRWVKYILNTTKDGRAPGTYDYFGVAENGKIYNTGTISKLFTNNAEGIYDIQLNFSPSCEASYPCPASGCDSRCNGVFQELGSDENVKYRLALMFPDDTGSGNGGKVFQTFDSNFTPATFTAIRNKQASVYSPLAESLYEASRYFAQAPPYYTNSPADYATSLGATGDPYYFASSGRMVPCSKSFVLFITAGEFSHDNSRKYNTTTTNTETINLPSFTLPDCASSTTNDCYKSDANFPTASYGGYMDDVAHYVHLSTTDLRPGSTSPSGLEGTQNLTTYIVSALGGGGNILKSAAKYGGFDDKNGNNKPDLVEEWSNDGGTTPKTYFEASQGGDMRAKIFEAIASILKSSASGTSVSVLATSAEGEGALYQAYFYPNKYETTTDKRVYLGYMRGLFLDKYGNLREDSNSDSSLVLDQDKIMRMVFNSSTFEVNVQLYSDSNEDGTNDLSTPDASVPLDALSPIWEGGKKLALRDKSTRNIYVWVDSDNDGVVDDSAFDNSDEGRLFSSDNASTLQPYLRAASSAEATNIINFIRGNPITGYRNRCLTVSGATLETGCSTGTAQRVWTLGDIVYSTPTIVAAPKEQYDIIYGEASYNNFKSTYKNRRNVVYVGANDGMLHAFNAGVYTPGDKSSTTGDTEHGWFIANPISANGWTSPTPGIGDELWAFVPHDNLPHLAWLTCGGTSSNPSACNSSSANYTHTYYVDSKPKVTDVRIFCDSDTTLNPPTSSDCVNGQATSHPAGWGTILIMGMRFGGGAMDVTADFGSGSQTRNFRSAYYAFDITDPEKPPKLLWRFTNSNLGFTTSYPGIVHIKSGSTEKWFMVVGSGPDNNAPTGTRGYNGSSTQQGSVFVVNLLNGASARTTPFTTDTNGFMGDPTVVDVDLNYTADVVYIGSVYSSSGSSNTWTLGKTYRIKTLGDTNPNNWTSSALINQGAPLLPGPSVSKDIYGNLWVFFGTGRLWNSTSGGDKDNSDQQMFFGIKDACWSSESACTTTYALSDLMNTTNLTVCTAGAGGGIYDTSTGTCGSGTKVYDAYSALLTAARATSNKGWYVNLNNPATPSERVLSRGAVLGGLVLFTSFTPNTDLCAFLGDSKLYSLYYETGTAYIKPTVGTTGSEATETIKKSIYLGKGMPTTVGVAVGETIKGFVQTSTGTIVEVEAQPGLGVRSGAASWREKTGGGGTSEIETIYKHIVK